MRDLVVFGNGDFARMLKYYIDTDDERSVAAFTVDAPYVGSGTHCGLPVVPFEAVAATYPPDRFDVLVAIGYSRMNELRRRVFERCRESGYSIASFVHSSCSVHSTDVGEGNILLERCLVYPFARLGSGNLLWDTVNISHDSVVGDFNTFAGGADLCGYVRIGNNCYLGKGCIVDNGAVLADYTLVGAGAYAKGRTSPYDVVVPARSVTLRGRRSTEFL